jgi:hypothetical protein
MEDQTRWAEAQSPIAAHVPFIITAYKGAYRQNGGQ